MDMAVTLKKTTSEAFDVLGSTSDVVRVMSAANSRPDLSTSLIDWSGRGSHVEYDKNDTVPLEESKCLLPES